MQHASSQTISLPWLSAGPLPPRRRRKRSKSSHNKESSDTPQHSNSSIPVLASAQIAFVPPETPPITPSIPIKKLAPKTWSDLVKASVGNGSPVEYAKSQTFGPRSFSSYTDICTKYDPSAHSKAPMIQPRGLINRGNMCFMNAVLQVLVFCPPFYNLFDRIGKEVYHRLSSRTPLIDAMVLLIREFQVLSRNHHSPVARDPSSISPSMDDVGEPFTPDEFYASMKHSSRFNSMQRGRQEDAEEFLGFLLDELHEEFLQSLKEFNGRLETSNHSAVSQESAAPASEEWLEVGKHQRVSVTRTASILDSPISRIFGGDMRSILRVAGAKDSVMLEPYQPLQLDIQSPNVKNIVDALANLPEPEVVSENWNNDNHVKVKATKQVYLESLPPVLILHLKRFLYDNVGGTQKSWKQVGYPLILDIPQCTLSPGRRSVKSKYKLTGVIYHHGPSASGGHYTVDVLRQDDKTWIHLDDTMINSVAPEDVAVNRIEECVFNGRPNKLAYILIYGMI